MSDQETPTPTLRETIDQYYALRGLTPPNDSESLLWLISELGELVDAWMKTKHPDLPSDARYVFDEMITLGSEAEAAVTNGKHWIRNNQPKGSIELGGEIGDVLMMLDRFAAATSHQEPKHELMTKLRRKIRELGLERGFERGNDIE